MGFLDELDRIDSQKQKAMPAPVAPQGGPSFFAKLDEIDKQKTTAPAPVPVDNRS